MIFIIVKENYLPNYKLNNLSLDIIGQSHSKKIIGTLKGLKSGEKVNLDILKTCVLRRSAGNYDNSLVTSRIEDDNFKIISGIKDDKTTGDDLIIEFENKNFNNSDYENISYLPRPSPSDYVSFLKYGKIMPGGGEFSGRMTAPLNALGAVCKSILENKKIKIKSDIIQVGNIKGENLTEYMIEQISKAKSRKDSIGAVVRTTVSEIFPCLGSPIFGSVESKISSLIFSIPGVKGIEFGKGFDAASLYGSEYNDQFELKDGKIRTKTNNDGGINGGITNGEDIVFDVVFKPTPSIEKKQMTVNLEKMQNEEIEILGRHDPCIAVRGAVVVETVTAIVIYDLILGKNK